MMVLQGGAGVMLYNDTTWNRLNRFFNIFHPKVYIFLLAVNAILLIYGIGSFANNKITIGEYVATVALVDLFTVVYMIFHCPKTLFLHKGTAEFDDYVNLRPKYIHGRGFWYLKVRYTVSGIQEIRFHQNAFEKLFDVGRISFSGKTTFTAKRDVDRIEKKDTFTICGIRDFSAFQAEHGNEPK
jgi:hypothetical protein